MKQNHKVLIVDLDGTLFDDSHRHHHIESRPRNFRKYFSGFMEDPVFPNIQRFVLQKQEEGWDIVILTGGEYSVFDIREKLMRYGIHGADIYSRSHGDYRPSPVFKESVLLSLFEKYGQNSQYTAIDDMEKNLTMFRKYSNVAAIKAEKGNLYEQV